MSFIRRSSFEWRLRTRSLALGERTVVMGVINVTPDSFSDGGRYRTPAAAVDGTLAMFEQGAVIVDLGGESTRPGEHEAIGASEEIDRVVPVIEEVLRHRPEAILSVDTYKAETAQAALRAGVEIVNDVSGLLWDRALAAVCAEARSGVVLMHTRGRPQEWRTLPKLAEGQIVPLVRRELKRQLDAALAAGILRERIVLDPGFGFGKIFRENYELIAGMKELRTLGQPLLAGVSRKSFLGRTLASIRGGVEPAAAERGNASLAAGTATILAGADLVRTHEVRPMVEAAAVADAILAAAAENMET
jgi:dihydropteroate synthase